MMTPSQIRQYEFKSAGRNAYKAEDVDSFFGEVLVSYERMYRENSELIKRVSLLADRLEQYKNDEVDIKQAVLSAQKAADIIVRDAQMASENAKAEAEAILAAAKGEAQIIKDDAERQAIADSDLLMSMARDKAEDILNKAKEKAHGILIAATDSASDTVGAANRTITSESLHYEMLKKEVSEFRASILAQYKAHIEMISKLPELADAEAAKLENPPVAEEVDVSKLEDAFEAEDTTEEEENVVLEYVEIPDEDDDRGSDEEAVTSEEDEIVVDDNISCEAEEGNLAVEEEDDVQLYEPSVNTEAADIPISRGFAVNTDDLQFDGFEDIDSGRETEDSFEKETETENKAENSSANVKDDSDSGTGFFDSIESITTDDEFEKPKKKGFFSKWK